MSARYTNLRVGTSPCWCRVFHLCLLTVIYYSLYFSTQAHAGAWAQPEGGLQLITTGYYYRTDSYRDNDGNRRAQPAYTKYELNPYLEYGLSNKTTLGLSTFINRTSGDLAGNREHNYGLSDTSIFVRRVLYQQDGFVASLEPGIKLPSLYKDSAAPRSGSKDADGFLRINGGYGFEEAGRNHYIDTSLGMNKRFGERHDQITFDVTAGIGMSDNLQLLMQQFSTFRMGGFGTSPFTQSGEDDYNLTKLQLSVVYRLEDGIALQLGGYRHIYARNTGEDGGIMAAIWKTF